MPESSILRISEAASLALHTTALLAAEPQRRIPASEIADRLNVSQAHLAKVLQRLARAGIVDSLRGPGGGSKLARPRNKITLLQIHEAVEGRLRRSRCLMGRPVCAGEHCILGELLETADTSVRAYLAGTKLSQLTDVYGQHNDTASDDGAAQ